MSEFNTTSIHDLPTDPAGGGSIGGNVSLVTNETNYKIAPVQGQQGQQGSGMSLDQSTISQIVNGLQQASIVGATSLPSRDIPQNTQQIMNDPAIQANYVPPPPENQSDYIKDEDTNYTYREESINSSLDSVYDEIQAPLLLSVLYFIFQLPIMRKLIFQYIPFLCSNDGNYNFNGLLFTSALFGFIYYSLTKTMSHFNKF
uniref:Uncharacterized protein n=1 Tax=viral metagenome TaxID=1070528 RepID=A0A6C0I8I7_9ZZZZ